MLDGKVKKYINGGNVQRENAMSKMRPESKTAADKMPGGGEKESVGKTEIDHHADGSHTVTHADGEKTEHPHFGHAAMEINGRVDPGTKGMHIHEDGGKLTSHHTSDGITEGPHEHAGMDDLKSHMDQVMGDADGGMTPEHDMGPDGHTLGM